ncbi:60S ribosomal protein L10a [Pteropus alecto]|uniref:60S ribosomal protein L10a n=1 Tax=Pteropus alecto TaxID=9402 RepID=L5KGL9_PTEAL|nr:60S ribosomal protein L10a [Pteropus alecto]
MDSKDVYRFEAKRLFPDKSQMLEEALASGDGHFEATVNLDQQHYEEAKAVAVPHVDIRVLKKLNKNKKMVKKLANKYDAFLASESLIKQIPLIMGPGLNKTGMFPSSLPHNENMVAKGEVPDEECAVSGSEDDRK